MDLLSSLSFLASHGQAVHQLLVIQALRPDRMLAMSHKVVQTILGENFMHDAEQGLDLASVVENEVCHSKMLLKSFHPSGHTLGFHPHSLKLEPRCTA